MALCPPTCVIDRSSALPTVPFMRLIPLACAFLALAFPALAQEKTPPNIVLLLSDDQAWTDYGFMGHEAIQTPNLDKLASQSALFPRGYVPTALCRPSLMTLVTGRYVHEHGVTGNDPSHELADPKKEAAKYNDLRAQLIAKIDDHPTVMQLLGNEGYLSHQSGKWWEGNFKRGGFTHGMTRGFPQPGGRHGDDGLKIGREGMDPVFEFIDMAVSEEKPFFVWYGPFLPHTPHNPPERLLKKYQVEGRSETVAKYYAMCEWFDETCGQLIDYLDDKGVRDNTLIVYICDNGWIQDPDSKKYAPRSKQSANEGGVRQPTIYNWPGVIEPKVYEDELVSAIDIFPTMLSAAGVPLPAEDYPGLDLMPVMRDGKELGRSIIFGEGFAHDVADIDKPEASLLYRWAIQGKWKLLLTYDGKVGRYGSSHPRTEKRPQLYNLEEDPHENHNVAKDHPEIVSSMATAIENWWEVKERKVQTTWTD